MGDFSPIDLGDGDEFAHCSCAEYFIGAVDFCQGEVPHIERDFVLGAEVQDGLACDAFGAGVCWACEEGGLLVAVADGDDEEVCGVCFGDEASLVEHDGVVCAGVVCFDFGEDGLDEVAVVDLWVHAVWGEASDGGGDEFEAGFGGVFVDGWFVFCEDDECWALGVESGVHAAGEFDASRECEADVDVVVHVVCLEGSADLFADFVFWGDLCEGEGLCA